jgi:hypothetical protein
MAQIIREIRVDVSQPNVFQAIVAKQLDCNSRFLKITLVDFGVKIEVPETAKVTINANRPDGKSQSFVGVANNDGTITVPLAQWMLEVAGELKCDVSVINTTDNKRLTSTDFFVNVQEAANKSTDISENPDGEIRVITPTQKIDENSSDDEYPSAKAVYELDNITATATGSAITIDSANAPLQNLKLFGKTEQNGTPTPDAPIDLVSIGDSGSLEVGVYGKNLYQNNATSKTVQGITYTVNDGRVMANGTASALSQLNLGTIRLPKGNYKATGYDGSISGVYLYVRASTDTGWRTVVGERDLTYTEDVNVYFLISIGAGVTVTNLTFYPMIRLATETDNTYEPCNKQALTMPYCLRGVGDIKDEIDFAKEIIIQRLGHIESYNGETITTEYISSTGELSTGAEVVYILPTPIETPLSETELNAYRQLYTNKGNTTILSECEDTEITYYINKPNAQAIGSLHEQINKDYIKLQQAIISTGGNV